MKWLKVVIVFLFTSTFGVALYSQQRDIYADPSNLTVLPKDISPTELASVMRKYK
ncbi:MAG: hypothetical protein ACI9H8_000794 [Lysobacterales bacterium]|jgi:hypothetical protein